MKRTITGFFFLLTLFAGCNVASAKKLIRYKRAWIIASFQVEEELPGPYPRNLGFVANVNDHEIIEIHGRGVDEEPIHVFDIDRHTGMLKLLKKVDYEAEKYFLLKFEAKTRSSAVTTRLGIEINVTNINDNPPEFQETTFTVTVNESSQQETPITAVIATDVDELDNSKLEYRIVSQIPKDDVVFFIQGNGDVSFKGCLDFQKVEKYTIVVEAKDNGAPMRLSSSCTIIVQIKDQNNHLPSFSGDTWTGKVKENDNRTSVVRLHVDDKDTRSSAAWRAIYTIHGDAENHFSIETDPKTNDGILSVIKPLDFETSVLRSLSITVENEAPFFFCAATHSPNSVIPRPQSANINITVEDANDPPEFMPAVKDVFVAENVQIGHLLETFTAMDQDKVFSNTIVYEKSEDLVDWVTVDPKTCKIYTKKIMDRESALVIHGVYTVTIHAVDKGKPPMTGTATLSIHLIDQNDNVPQLTVNVLDMCLVDGPSVANITVYDLDGDPYAGPFHFELLGDVKGRWRLDPDLGTTVKLVMEKTVYAGFHHLALKISDAQGQSSVQNLLVTVCDCLASSNCREHRVTPSSAGTGAVVVAFASLFILLACMLLALSASPEKKEPMPVFQVTDSICLHGTEELGDDCELPFYPTKKPEKNKPTLLPHRPQIKKLLGKGTLLHTDAVLYSFIMKKIHSIETLGNELTDYDPHVYADEGPPLTDPELDSITGSEDKFNLNDLLDLGPQFSHLAAICKSELGQNDDISVVYRKDAEVLVMREQVGLCRVVM